jgi:hypothetical protein
MEPTVRPGPRHGVVGILAGLHLAGAVLAWLLLVFVIPLPPEAREPQVRWGTTALVTVYGFFATAVVVRFGRALLVPVETWVASGSLADEATQARVLDAPLILTRRAAQLWAGATLLGPATTPGSMACWVSVWALGWGSPGWSSPW